MIYHKQVYMIRFLMNIVYIRLLQFNRNLLGLGEIRS